MADIPRSVEAVIMRAKEWYDSETTDEEAAEILVALVEAVENSIGFASGPMAMTSKEMEAARR